MIYLVKNKSGAEFEVSEQHYHRLKKKGNHECRVVGADPEPITPQTFDEWPKPDKKGSWFTLSNGKRVNGEANAKREQDKIDGTV